MAPKSAKRSVIKTPTYEMSPAGGLILSLASIADDFPPWGSDPSGLDWKLRTFWPTESFMQSAIYAIATRNAAFSWTLQGPDSLVEYYRDLLTESWVELCYKWNIDYLTQNNGAFIEIVRESDKPDSPCIGINYLDSQRCARTGMPEKPVSYQDIIGLTHVLLPHQVWAMADMPSPIETMNGVGMCAVYRVLREALRMRDISIHDREKLSGNNPKGLILVNNIGQKQLQDVVKQHTENQMQKGFVRYVRPAIYASLDPAKPASAQVIDFATMGDGFDKDKELKWYITVLALALGCDYQDLAPLASGSLGTSQQSQTLHLKSKGKGPAMYMKRFAHMMNFSGILPRSVEFEFDEKDVDDDIQQQSLSNAKAQERQVYISAGVKSALAVRTEMLQAGEITQEVFDLMAKEDLKRQEEDEAKRQEQTARLNAIRPSETTQEDESSPTGDISGPTTEDEKAKHDYADKLRKRLEGALAKEMTGALKKALAVLKGRIEGEKDAESWDVWEAGGGGDKPSGGSGMGAGYNSASQASGKPEPKWHQLGSQERLYYYNPDKIREMGNYQLHDWDEDKVWIFKNPATEAEFRDKHPLANITNNPLGDKKIYFRYGVPPKSGRSGNYQTGGAEAGVSVYVTPYGSGGAAFFADRDIYYGEGRQSGWGSDGEPVVVISSQWKKYKPKKSQLDDKSKDIPARWDDFIKRLTALIPNEGKKAVENLADDEELWGEMRQIVQGVMTPFIRKVALEAARYKADLGFSVNMDMVNQGILAFTRNYTNEWWGRLKPTTREGLRTALVTWQESGLGKQGLPDLINALEETLFSPERARLIGVTEVTRIFDEGNRLAEMSIGIETQEWQTAGDETVCEICEPLDGKRFPIESGPYPVTDSHPNCRCARLGVSKRGELMGD